ncbi:MAG TPA: efflux RND transporter periplasmic adaptor subunit [Candidatus Udaeobacter sp.]|nr:efflux RND transporter periplasmic adaptor subunit [Candidatus Udaeobacter sp.]
MSHRPTAAPSAPGIVLVLALVATALCSVVAGCNRRGANGADSKGEGSLYQTAAAEREDLVVTAAATGTIEPVRVVEVKSKASGEILKMTVESGDRVEKGALMVQLDQKDTKNQLDRAQAAVEVARARFKIAEGQLARSQQLLDRQTISPQEHEATLLEHANANAALVTAEIDLNLAKERLADTTVRAPITGVVISKLVEEGQIISSATSQVSGGTTLLLMATLDEVQVRAMVDEIDVGRIRPGQEAKIKVDAYPDARFSGNVLKIEPQAVVDQNVTTFPVLVRIPNERGLLLPGMNCEVEVEIYRRDAALVVPNEAVRTPQEAKQTAAALGLEVAGLDQLPTGRGRGTAEAAEASGPAVGSSSGAGATGNGDARSERSGGDNAGRRGNGGRRWQGGNGAQGSPGGGARAGSGAPADSSVAGPGGGSNRPRGEGRPAVVFLVAGDKLTATPVRIGVRNWDDTEILSGLEEGQTVAVMPSTSLLREQAQFRQRMQQQAGNATGLQRQTDAGAGGSGGAAGGSGGGGGR